MPMILKNSCITERHEMRRLSLLRLPEITTFTVSGVHSLMFTIVAVTKMLVPLSLYLFLDLVRILSLLFTLTFGRDLLASFCER